jgi:hypothetical protein
MNSDQTVVGNVLAKAMDEKSTKPLQRRFSIAPMMERRTGTKIY